LSLVKEAIGPGPSLRRHLAPLLFLLSVIAAIIAVARPTAVIFLPSQQQTVILAVDVSLSMSATDVDPNRLTAAQAAAKAFVEERPPHVRVGLVAFGGSASLVQPPTEDRHELLAAIDRFQLQRATATGSALYVALAALLPDAGIDLDSLVWQRGTLRDSGRRMDTARKEEERRAEPVPPGSFASGVIILMSDGRRTVGPDPLDAAKLAADHGVRVFTVGFGTAEGTLIGVEGGSIYVRLDEETLKAVADVTRGDYFHAATATDLKNVYQRLNARLVIERKNTEITFLFTAAAAVLMLASLLLSLLWFSRGA
jgi:Ca-activated chloride channel family protein